MYLDVHYDRESGILICYVLFVSKKIVASLNLTFIHSMSTEIMLCVTFFLPYFSMLSRYCIQTETFVVKIVQSITHQSLHPVLETVSFAFQYAIAHRAESTNRTTMPVSVLQLNPANFRRKMIEILQRQPSFIERLDCFPPLSTSAFE